VEYAIIAAWIGVAIVLGVTLLGGVVQDLFQKGLDGFP
jgi:Flp pilus assembly pilin Flp